MANRRMFCKDIVRSDAFLDMPISAQCLYFHLGMEADDDGFCGSPRTTMRLIGSSTDDLKLLFLKRFVLEANDGVVIIKHWWMHNTIRKDTYKPSNYLKDNPTLALDENNSYTFDDGKNYLEFRKEKNDSRYRSVNEPLTQYNINKKKLKEININEINIKESNINNKENHQVNENAIAENETKPISNPKPFKNIIEKALELTKQGEHITMSYFDDYGDYLTFAQERDKLKLNHSLEDNDAD